MGHLVVKFRSSLAAIVFLLILIHSSAALAAEPVLQPLQVFPPTPRAVHEPSDVVEDGFGNVWVADAANDRVLKFSPIGSLLGSWESADGTPFNRPAALAVAPSGRVYVADTQNNRVVIIGAAGQIEGAFGSAGSANGQFALPSGVVVSPSGAVYVADTGNNRIQHFTAVGAYQGSFGSLGELPGQFTGPRGLSLSGDNLYVADAGNRRISVITTAGTWVGSWGPYQGPSGGVSRYATPSDVWVDGTLVYVADSGNNQVEVCGLLGGTPVRYGTLGAGPGAYDHALGVFARAGTLWVADSKNNRIQKQTTTGAFLEAWQAANSASDGLAGPLGVAVDAGGNTFVADRANNRVQKYSASGVHLRSFGVGDLSSPSEVVVDPAGNIYVSDTGGNRIMKYASGGASLGPLGTGLLSAPTGLALDVTGNLYVVDAGNSRICIFDTAGVLVRAWGAPGAGVGQFNGPRGIAVAGSDVYVADTGNSRISQFTVGASITSVRSWGSDGTLDGQFREPSDVVVAGDGSVWVADTGNDRLQQFSAVGAWMTSYGSTGASLGRFHAPYGIATSPGRLTVSERAASRMQQIGIDIEPPATTFSGVTDQWSIDPTFTLTVTDDVAVDKTYYRFGAGSVAQYTGPFKNAPQGVNSFHYWSVDKAGRYETTKTATVRIDRTPPVSDSNLKNQWVGESFLATLSANDSLSGLPIRPITYSVDGGPEQEYTAGFMLSEEGTRTVRFFATDLAGNVETSQTGRIGIDYTAPRTEAQYSGAWRTTPTTIALTATDAGSGVAQTRYMIPGAAAQPYGTPFGVDREGETRVSFWSRDAVGNSEVTRTATIRIDRTAPVTTLTVGPVLPDDTRYLYLDATDPNGAGVHSTYYSVNDINATVYGGPVLVPVAEQTKIEFWSVDEMGHQEATKTVTVTYDMTPPQTTATMSQAWTTGTVSCSLAATDSVAGVDTVFYRIGSGPSLTYSAPFIVDLEGETPVRYWSVDKQGNQEETHTAYARIDRTSPTVSSEVEPGWPPQSNTVTLTASDPLSGAKTIEYRVDDAQAWTPYTGPVEVTGPGAHVMWYRATDAVGNRSGESSCAVQVRGSQPPVTSISGHAGWMRSATIALDATGAAGLTPETFYRFGAGSTSDYAAPFTMWTEGLTTLTFWSEVAGVSEDTRTVVIHIDRRTPFMRYLKSSTHPNRYVYYRNRRPAFSWSSADSLGKVKGYSYVLDRNRWTYPPRRVMTTGRYKQFGTLSTGVWYMHVRPVDYAGNWGKPQHLQIRVR